MQFAPNCTFDFGPMRNINCDGCGCQLPRDAMLATTAAPDGEGDDFCETCALEKNLWENPENARVVHFDVRMAEYMKQLDASGENRRVGEQLLAMLGRVDWPELQVQEAAPGVPPMAPQRQAADS
ncbi:MAG: hypothetical protein CMK83_00650 [Pseudomonadales bacterium]|nr:hypothetical protein [Pseudomonadales bacterium]